MKQPNQSHHANGKAIFALIWAQIAWKLGVARTTPLPKICADLIMIATLSPTLASASCWQEAGASYGIEPTLLKAIAWKESRGHPEAIGPTNPKTGHRAYGLMQIYSVHLPLLSKYGITKEKLFDACTSQKVGAWVLADCIQRFGQKWKAVGCYYTGPASKNTAAQAWYVRDVQTFYEGYKRQEQRDQSQTDSMKEN